MSLQFLLPFFSVFLEISIDIQLRQRLSFDSPPSWHHATSDQMISSGFPCLFLEHSSFDDFCTPCCCFFTYSHSLWPVSQLCLCHFFVVCGTFPAASSIPFCIVQVFFLPFAYLIHHGLLLFNSGIVIFLLAKKQFEASFFLFFPVK